MVPMAVAVPKRVLRQRGPKPVWVSVVRFMKRKLKCTHFNVKGLRCGKLGHSEKFCHKVTYMGTASTSEEVSAPVKDSGKVGTMTGMDGMFCPLSGKAAELRGASLPTMPWTS